MSTGFPRKSATGSARTLLGPGHHDRSVVKAFSDYLFETFEFNRLFAGIFSSNPASGRVLEKAGYTREAILRAHVTKNGELLDEYLYSRLRPGLSTGLISVPLEQEAGGVAGDANNPQGRRP